MPLLLFGQILSEVFPVMQLATACRHACARGCDGGRELGAGATARARVRPGHGFDGRRRQRSACQPRWQQVLPKSITVVERQVKEGLPTVATINASPGNSCTQMRYWYQSTAQHQHDTIRAALVLIEM